MTDPLAPEPLRSTTPHARLWRPPDGAADGTGDAVSAVAEPEPEPAPAPAPTPAPAASAPPPAAAPAPRPAAQRPAPAARASAAAEARPVAVLPGEIVLPPRSRLSLRRLYKLEQDVVHLPGVGDALLTVLEDGRVIIKVSPTVEARVREFLVLQGELHEAARPR